MGATTNLVVNPSWETGTANWTEYNVTSYTRVPAYSTYGSYSGYLVGTVSGSQGMLISGYMNVTAGTVYTLSAYISKIVSASQAYTGTMEIAWYTAASAYISSHTTTLAAGNFDFMRFTLAAQAPATAAAARIKFSDTGITTGDWYIWIDGVQFEAQPAATAYCDGDQPGCSWSGTAHASTSSRAAEAAYTTITITDGTTTLTLTDGRNYALVDAGWAPNVASLRQSTMGGSGPYNDVEEQITLNVLGETGVEVLFNLGELSRMLDQAERWSRGEPVSAVKLTYQPQGSVLTAALSCVILGRAGQMAVSTPASFNDLLMCYEISNVQLSFRRRGLWLGAAQTVNGSSFVDNSEIMTLTLTAQTVSSPTKLTIEVNGTTVPRSSEYVYVLWADAATKLKVLEAEDFAVLTGSWSTPADATGKARGGNVARFTPASTAAGVISTITAITIGMTSVRRIAIFAAVRNNSATVTWTFRAIAGAFSASNTTVATPAQTIDCSTLYPRLLFLGIVSLPSDIYELQLEATPASTSGSPTLDIDYVAMVGVDNDRSGILTIETDETAVVDHHALDGQTPTVSDGKFAYMGDAWISSAGSAFTAVVLGDNDSAVDRWLMVTSGNALVEHTIDVTRLAGYLTPQ